MQRFVTGAGLTLVLVAALFLLSDLVWLVLVSLLAAACAVELGRMLEGSAPGSPRILLPPVVVASIAAMLLAERAAPGHELILAGAVVVVVPAMLALLQGRAERVWPAVPWLSFGALYLALPSVAVIRLRQEAGPWVVFLLIGIVGIGDTAAFYFGRRFGRTKLAPSLSPKKTWAGSVGGVAAAVVFAAAWSWLRLGRQDPLLLGLAGATQAVGQFGDLLESAMKRTSGIKDSGDLLPGHGGLLDRTDAMLLAAPVFSLGVFWLGEGWG